MYVPSITAAFLALTGAALALQTMRLRRSSPTIFNGGIVLGVGLLIASALPILSRLPWADLADEASDEVATALHFLEIAYTILTL